MIQSSSSNLAVLAEAAQERRGDETMLLFEGRRYMSTELFGRATRIAAALSELGLRAGDRAIVTMANCPEVTVAYHALWRAGAVVTPVTFLLPPAELRAIAADSGARFVLCTPDLLAGVREALDGLDQAPQLLCTEPVEGLESLSELAEATPTAIVPRGDDELAALLYTGGTTGRAKGVMLTHAALHCTGAAAQRAAYVPGVVRNLLTLPLSHAYGLLVTLSGMHSPEPTHTVLLRWFESKLFLSMIQEHGLQQSALVPAMFGLLLSEPLEDWDLNSLVQVSSGGAPLAPEIAEAFVRRVPAVAIRQGYGLTETAALVSTQPAQSTRPTSVGRPVEGTEVRVLSEAGEELAPGEVGEICCRSPGLMRGYWNAPEATASAIVDGWLHTGDLGCQDDEGYLFIVDRKKDLIIRGGFNVYPRDVEDALVEHPDVELAGVVGRPDERRGEEVVAFVSLRGGSTLSDDDLVNWARERIGGYRYPREVHIVEQIPLTPVGKIDRKLLRARINERP